MRSRIIGEGQNVFEQYVRIEEAWIASVDAEANRCNLVLALSGKAVTNALLNVPYASASGDGIRFCPKEGAYCVVGFTSSGIVEILAYSLKSLQDVKGVGTGNSGNQIMFRKLKKGEIDITSLHGLGEVYLASDGTVLIAAKNNNMLLDATNNRVWMQTSLNKVSANEVYVNQGRVERILGTVKKVAYNATGLLARAYEIIVKKSGMAVGYIKFGDVVDDSGTVVMGAKGSPLVLSISISSQYSEQVDSTGNLLRQATTIEEDATQIIENGTVVLGAKASSDPAVLGNEVQQSLNDIVQALQDVVTAFGNIIDAQGGTCAAPLAAAVTLDIAKIQADVQTILAKKVTLT